MMSAERLVTDATRQVPTPAAVITNKNKKSLDPLRAKNIFIRKAAESVFSNSNTTEACFFFIS